MAMLMVVEDDQKTNEAISAYLRGAEHSIISAYDGIEALELFGTNKIDLVILDIMLPKLTGLAVLESIRKTSAVPVLMLTAIEDEYTQILSFDGLADDYLTKPFSMILLGKRVTALLRRSGKTRALSIWTNGDITVDFSGYAAYDSDGKIDVTRKELEILRLLIDHQGLVLSRSQILDAVWEDGSYVIDRLVDTYIKNLRKKLRLDCITTVIGVGYKLEGSK